MSDEKIQCKENIFAKSGFVLGIVSIITAFVPFINYLAIVMAILAIIFELLGIWQKSRKEVVCVGIVLGVLSIIITYVVINYKTDFFLNKIGKESNELNMKINNEYSNNTEEVLANEVDVIFGTYEESSIEYDYEYDMISNSTKLPVTLRNKSNETKSFNITIEAVDENGDRITEDTVYVEKLRAGQTYKTDAFYYVSDEMTERMNNATFVVLDASAY